MVRKKLEFLSPCSYQLLRKLASESKTLNNTSAFFFFLITNDLKVRRKFRRKLGNFICISKSDVPVES